MPPARLAGACSTEPFSFDRVNDLLVTLQNPALANGAIITYFRRATFPLYDWGLNANLGLYLQVPHAQWRRAFCNRYRAAFRPASSAITLDQLATLDTFFLRENVARTEPDTYEGSVFQADYTRPLGERWKVETGLRLNLPQPLHPVGLTSAFNRTLEQF
jgi:hypothetical protein